MANTNQAGFYHIKTRGEKVFDVFNIIFMILLSLAFVIPFIYILGNSLATEQEQLRRGFLIIPQNISFEAYSYLSQEQYKIVKAFKDTTILTLGGTFLKLLITTAMAYGLAKKSLRGRNVITAIVFFTMLFNGGMIPTYFVVKETYIFNSYWALILPGLVSAWNLFILRNFFAAIPQELEESAYIDGANDIQILFKIILPLSIPAMITIGMFYGVSLWNTWFDTMIYVPKGNIVTLQLVLRDILSNQVTAELRNDIGDTVPIQQLQMAAIVISVIPVIVAFPFVQKYFVKGVMIGSIKG